MAKSINDLYPGGSYLNASDVPKSLTAEITAVEVAVMPQSKDEKLVATLAGNEKRFALNSTNAHACAEAWGEDYDAWVGKTMTIRPVATKFNGANVKGLRVFFD